MNNIYQHPTFKMPPPEEKIWTITAFLKSPKKLKFSIKTSKYVSELYTIKIKTWILKNYGNMKNASLKN